MIIRKFIAKTENEATAAAKKELGEGMVIMNVRYVKPKGPFRFSKRNRWNSQLPRKMMKSRSAR